MCYVTKYLPQALLKVAHNSFPMITFYCSRAMTTYKKIISIETILFILCLTFLLD